MDLPILHLGSPDLLDEYVSEGRSARKLDLEEAKEAEGWHAPYADLEFVIQTTLVLAQILDHHEYPNVQEDASGITTIRPSAEHLDNQLRAHRYYKGIRDKHIAHSVDPFEDFATGARDRL